VTTPPDRSGSDLVPGDPVSCSALGGDLRRRAAQLRERRTVLQRTARARLTRTGASAEAFSTRMRAQLAAIEQMAGRLDDAGAALQAYATDLAHAREQGRLAASHVQRHGLVVGPDGVVAEPPTPTSLDEAVRRREALPYDQHRVDAALAQARAAADQLARRASGVINALRSDMGRLAALDAPAR
jgi:hypothetical protein